MSVCVTSALKVLPMEVGFLYSDSYGYGPPRDPDIQDSGITREAVIKPKDFPKKGGREPSLYVRYIRRSQGDPLLYDGYPVRSLVTIRKGESDP